MSASFWENLIWPIFSGSKLGHFPFIWTTSGHHFWMWPWGSSTFCKGCLWEEQHPVWQRKELKVLVKRADGQELNPVGLGCAGKGSWIFFSLWWRDWRGNMTWTVWHLDIWLLTINERKSFQCGYNHWYYSLINHFRSVFKCCLLKLSVQQSVLCKSTGVHYASSIERH